MVPVTLPSSITAHRFSALQSLGSKSVDGEGLSADQGKGTAPRPLAPPRPARHARTYLNAAVLKGGPRPAARPDGKPGNIPNPT